MRKRLKARSPAKLILSGEHSVVYGRAALALAIDRYAYSTVLSSLSSAILVNCLNLKYARSFRRQTLKMIKERIQLKYRLFLEGDCSIRQVLKKPFELLQYTVVHLLESLNVSILNDGLEIRSASNIPIGCGMGSSAAVVMSTLYALAHFFKLDLEPAYFLSLGREAENLQHGRSSGLDVQLTLLGGCLHFKQGQILKREMPKTQFLMVQTGKPLSTTGECVSASRIHFKHESLLDDFEIVTQAFDQALQANDYLQMQACMRENHRLLVNIGVVPLRIQAFIQALEAEGAAAKICGAGAIKGDRAGALLVLGDAQVLSIAADYGYGVQAVRGDMYGTCLL